MAKSTLATGALNPPNGRPRGGSTAQLGRLGIDCKAGAISHEKQRLESCLQRQTTLAWALLARIAPRRRIELTHALKHRPTTEIPLHQPDAGLDKKVPLACALYALGDDLDAQVIADAHQAADNGLSSSAGIHTANQPHVDLDEIRLEISEEGQACIAGAEIIDGGEEAAALVFTQNLRAIVYAAAIGIFHVRIDGSVPGVVGIAIAFALLTSSFGLLIAAIGKTPEATRGLAIFATLLDAMTWRGLGFDAAIAPIVALLLFSTLFAAIAIWRFDWEEPRG